jgi:hypothetical protein
MQARSHALARDDHLIITLSLPCSIPLLNGTCSSSFFWVAPPDKQCLLFCVCFCFVCREAAVEIDRQRRASASGPARRKISLVVSHHHDDDGSGKAEEINQISSEQTQGQSAAYRRPPPPANPGRLSNYSEVELRGSVSPRASAASDDLAAVSQWLEGRGKSHDGSNGARRSDNDGGDDDDDGDSDNDGSENDGDNGNASDDQGDVAEDRRDGDFPNGDGGEGEGEDYECDDDNDRGYDAHGSDDGDVSASNQPDDLGTRTSAKKSLAGFAAAARAALGKDISPPPSANGTRVDRLDALCNNSSKPPSLAVQQGSPERRSDMRRRVWHGSSPTGGVGVKKAAAVPVPHGTQMANDPEVHAYWAAAARLEDLNALDLADMVRSLRRDLRRSEDRAVQAVKEADNLRAQLASERENSADLADALDAQKVNRKSLLHNLYRCSLFIVQCHPLTCQMCC